MERTARFIVDHGVRLLICSAVFIAVLFVSASIGRRVPYWDPSVSSLFLALGLGALAADLAAGPVDALGERVSLARLGALAESRWTRLGLWVLALPGSLYLLLLVVVFGVSSAGGLFSGPFWLSLGLHALAWAGLLGLWAVWTRILRANDSFRRSRTLYRMTLIGLPLGLLVAWPGATVHLGFPSSYPTVPDYAPYVLFGSYTVASTFLFLGLLGLRRD